MTKPTSGNVSKNDIDAIWQALSKKADTAAISQLKFDLRQLWREDDESSVVRFEQKCDGLRFDLDRLSSAFDEHTKKTFNDLAHRV